MSEMEAQQQQARLLIGRMYPTRRASPPSRRVRRAPVRIAPVAPVAFALAGPPVRRGCPNEPMLRLARRRRIPLGTVAPAGVRATCAVAARPFPCVSRQEAWICAPHHAE